MKLRIGLWVVSASLLLPFSLFGKCPIPPTGTLEFRVPAGNLLVETSGTDSVEVDVSNRQITVQENCGKDVVTIGASMSSAMGIPDWKIRVPQTVALDISIQAGNIQVADTEGRETRLRTAAGKVTAGNIKGSALILANEVRTGDIGGHAEIRGQGGRLQVGEVGGNADFYSTGGDINTGLVKGRVKADTGSGSIMIRESSGDMIVTTKEGDIVSDYVHGAFDGTTQSGNIRIEKIGSWVHAISKSGDVFFHLVPQMITNDLHVKVEAGRNITMFLPEKISATVDAIVDSPAFNAKRIFFDWPSKAVTAPFNAVQSLIPSRTTEPAKALVPMPGGPEQARTVINTGTNSIKAHSYFGIIKIQKGN